MKHIGHLIVTKSNLKDCQQITEVTGYLSIGAEASLPVLTSVGGDLSIAHGIKFDYLPITFGAGEVMAVWEYALHFKDGSYRAGCRGTWTANKVLEHWAIGHHAPSRAALFRETIEKHQVAA